ncbi:MAG: toll/interleukin-1 receptor domain-containing protein, partial [Promethearchaeota archaeon]
QKAMVLPGGKGYKVWFKSKYGINETTIDLSMSDPKRICDCRMSKLGGFCIHQLAIYLMLINKRTCTISDIPFKVDEDWFESIKKRLDLRAAQSLFKEDPAIMLSNGYQVFINGNLVSYKWTGDYAGKKTVELPQEDLELHIAKKIVDIILKPINTKTREGTPEKIIFDSINIIEKITTNPKLVDKILKKFEIFEDPELPKNELDLQAFLKSNLKESIEDFKLQPPFKAYDGFEPFLFVSYAHKDISSVYPIIKKLNLSGINIWYDEGIPLTSDWGDILGQKIIDSQLFLSFISPHVNDSINTQKEIKYAALKNKPFISIFLKKTELSPGIEMIIQDVQGLMKYKMEDKQFYDNLINEIKKIL